MVSVDPVRLGDVFVLDGDVPTYSDRVEGLVADFSRPLPLDPFRLKDVSA